MDFNTRIAAFFLHNNRLTALFFFLLLLLGGASTFLLKTTGFPSPDIGFAIVQTFYFGASAGTVANEVTAPLELALRDVSGIATMSSTSSDSVSFISLGLKDGVSTDGILNELNSALQSVSLPEGVEDPKVIIPSIEGADFAFSLLSNEEEALYADYRALEEQIRALPETSEVTSVVAFEKRILITLNEEKMATLGVTREMVAAALATVGESLPVVSGVELEKERQSVVTTVSGSSFSALSDLHFGDPAAGVFLRDFATIQEDYSFDQDQASLVAYNVDGDGFVFSALHFQVKAASGTDLMAYSEALEEIFEEVDDLKVVKGFSFEDGFDGTLLVENYSVRTQNERQVEEVVSGLVGGPLHGDAPWSYAGWLLGGIQLVFLVMIFFVSWRAAVVAALAIPLSLVFSNIYIYFSGENLNTLVLFSLVLAIGLVVDPALVLLESIQRKIDLGLRGKQAALAAVQDVGMGLFLACLTSAIVFIPFGVVSGVLGQIITYIPVTVIPAVVGSYVVPLVFLAWMGGAFLRRRPGKSNDEESNLWGVARLVIRINEWLLFSPRILRFFIIVLALVVPVAVAGYCFSSGTVKSVQFSSDDNSDFMQLSFTHFPSTTEARKAELLKDILEVVASNDFVEAVFPYPTIDQYFVQLVSVEERGEYESVDIAEDINRELERDYSEDFFDLKVDVISNGPPASAYQVSLQVDSTDLTELKNQAELVAKDALRVCLTDGVYAVQDTCEGEAVVDKVDDGFTGKETQVVEVLLDRKKLAEKQLILPGAPLGLLVNQALRNMFSVNGGEAVGKVMMDGETVDIVLDKTTRDPRNLQEISNTVIYALNGSTVRLGEVATLRTVDSPASIMHFDGKTVALVKVRLEPEHNDPATASLVTQAIIDYEKETNPEISLAPYSEGDTAGFIKSFTELFTALLLSILITYIVLVLFFGSFTQPLVILFAVPLTFVGVFPALAILGNGQFGFLEIIGLIILVGIVENVAIFLIDAARQKMREDGWDEVRAISYASGLRFRAVILTKLTAIASLAPLAFLSPQYRSLALVIIFGLLTSGLTSLFTTPILFVFFRWLSKKVRGIWGGGERS